MLNTARRKISMGMVPSMGGITKRPTPALGGGKLPVKKPVGLASRYAKRGVPKFGSRVPAGLGGLFR